MTTTTPAYKLVINGQDKTSQFQGRLISLTLTDNAGFDVDRLDIRLDDTEGKLSLPASDAVIQLSLGEQGTSLIDKGKFTVDEVSHSGPPDTITIKASSTGFDPKLKTQRQFAWHEVTLGDIVTTIAKRYTLTAAISSELDSIAIAHIDQTNESDAHFLTRLSVAYGAIATIKNERLLFISRGKAKTASGTALPEITIERQESDRHTYRVAKRNGKYTGVKARWLDTDTAKAEYILAGEDGTVKTLTKTFPSEPEAYHAAEAELKKILTGGVSLQLNLSSPMLELMPEQAVKAAGWKSVIDDQKWFVSGPVVHQLGTGLTTQITLAPLT